MRSVCVRACVCVRVGPSYPGLSSFQTKSSRSAGNCNRREHDGYIDARYNNTPQLDEGIAIRENSTTPVKPKKTTRRPVSTSPFECVRSPGTGCDRRCFWRGDLPPAPAAHARLLRVRRAQPNVAALSWESLKQNKRSSHTSMFCVHIKYYVLLVMKISLLGVCG